MTTPNLLDAALDLWRKGYNVLPVAEDKRPIGKWKRWQTVRQTETDARASPWLNAALIGVVCGSVSGNLAVLDWDVKDGGPGLEAYNVFHTEHPGSWPEQDTRSGGKHTIGRLSGRTTKLYLDGELCGDLKAGNGMVIAWNPDAFPPIADLPQFPLLEGRVRAGTGTRSPQRQKQQDDVPDASKHQYALSALANEVQAVITAPQGSRNDQLNKSAFSLGQLVGAGILLEETVRAELQHAARHVGLDDPETLATIESGIQAGKHKPRDLSHLGRKRAASQTDGVQAESSAGEQPRLEESQANRLVRLAEHVDLWHTPEGDAYADTFTNNHRETHPIRGKAFKHWLSYAFYQAERKAPGAQALQDALNVLEGRARYEGKERPVFVRLAHAVIAGEPRIYLDLGREDWKAVEITRNGWQVIPHPPVRFRRPKNLKPLPEPVSGGNLDALRTLLNVTCADWPLVAGWLIGCLSPGPYPVLLLIAEQGSGKSTVAERARSILDPGKAGLRAEPRDVRDLMIAASNGHVLAFDNLSGVPVWLSDALCRIATGGGFSTRELYSDQDETILDVTRPLILTGIADLATRGDLLDRSIIARLEPITPDRRRTKAQLDQEFEAIHPSALGVLLTAASRALRDRDTVKLPGLPRMADFAVWVAAAAPELGFTVDEFLAAYDTNRNDAHSVALESSSVAAVLREWLGNEGDGYEGTVGGLLKELNLKASDEVKRSKGWPKSARSLGSQLREIAPNLRGVGFTVVLGKRRENGIPVTIERASPARSERSDVQEDLSAQSSDAELGPNTVPQRKPDVQQRTANVQTETPVLNGPNDRLNILNVEHTPVPDTATTPKLEATRTGGTAEWGEQ